MKTPYTSTAIALHWLMAVLLFMTFPLGIYMYDLPLSPEKLKLYSYHKWIGVTIFLLACLRMLWRLRHPTPPLPRSMPDWQQKLAKGIHHLFYLLLFLIPLSGWLMSSALGVQTVWFGLIPLPDLVGEDAALGEWLKAAHKALNILLLIGVIVHVAAAVKHHVVDRDDVLARMLPFLK